MAIRRSDWHSVSKRDVANNFTIDVGQGLSRDEVVKRQERYGRNILEEEKDFGLLGRAVKQLRSPLVYILLLAGIATLFLQEYLDTIVIFVALTINVVVGAFQEERASKAFEKLNTSQKKEATVFREGRKIVISAQEVVPGDIVALLSGMSVPADIRLLEARELAINEAALTGEWVSVHKDTEMKERVVPLAQQSNMAWMGTLVSSGYGKGIVVNTGMDTELGAIAESLTGVEEHETPLQQNVGRIARFLVVVIGIAILIIFGLGLLRGEPFGEMLLISIAVAVASMPGGLPAAVTIVLALGMESILKRGGLVRNLLAAETLGSTTIILTDKTGTLTEAKMALSSLYTLGGAEKSADTLSEGNKKLLEMAVLSSDAFVEGEREEGLIVRGRPMERAILLAGLEQGIMQERLESDNRELDFLSFDSQRRFSATLRELPGAKKKRLYFSGAPEYLLEKADFVLRGGREIRITKALREQFADIQRMRSREGMRMIGISYVDVASDKIPSRQNDKELLEKGVFVGFLSFSDPVRSDVKEAIKTVKGAGARVVMLTGDNLETAQTIAREVGIAGKDARILTGTDIEKMNDKDLLKAIQETAVFARVLPNQKLRIARILKDAKEIVAMTGDGINDAPALLSANIGVAVGSGTEVAKEASDIVLINNSFSIIVAAIEEGRKIIDNLKKIIAYLLSTSFSEVLVIGGGLIFGAPLPLLPSQILWANIVEEGFMSFAFAFEGKEKGIMKRDPRSHEAKTVLTPALKKLIFLISAVTGVFLLVLFAILLFLDLPIEEVRTFMFAALSLDSIFFAFSFKSLHQPIWHINPFTNRYLLLALFGSIALLFAALTLAPLQKLLSLTQLSFIEGLVLAGVGLFNLIVIEVAKYFIFERWQVQE